MHGEAILFTLFVRRILSHFFNHKKVLDVGGGDINGNNRHLFNNCDYYSNDVIPAPNVTIVSKTKDLSFSEKFDVICSTECFEHDPEYTQSFLNIYNLLKPGGLFFFTCASEGRAEHGTRRTSPNESYGTIGNLPDMSDYYKNITIHDLNQVLPLKKLFSSFDVYYNYISFDLYFVGIKNGPDYYPLETYKDRGVVHLTAI